MRTHVAISVAIFLLSAHRALAQHDSDRAVVGLAAESYIENRESFQWISCNFTLKYHTTESAVNALAKKYLTTSDITYRGEWFIDGKSEKYYITYDSFEEAFAKAQQQARRAGSRKGSMEGYRATYITNGELFLDKAPLGRVAHMFTINKGESQPTYGGIVTPFNFGMFGPNNDPGLTLRQCLNGKLHYKYQGKKQLFGRDMVVITWGRSANEVSETFYFDPEKGYLPICVERYDPATGSITDVVYVTDVRLCSKQRWFPMKFTVVNGLSTNPVQKPIARELVTTRLDVDTPPQEKDISMVLPEGTQINDPDDNMSGFSTRADITVSPSKLNELNKAIRASSQQANVRRGTSFVYPGEGSGQRRWSTIVIAHVVLVSSVIIVCGFRHLRRRRDPLS